MTANPFSTTEPWDAVATRYTSIIQRVFEKWARDSFDRVALKRNDRVLDVGCGPGTVALLAAPLVEHVTAVDFSPAMIAELKTLISEQAVSNVTPLQCDGARTALLSDSFDVAFSQFGLMFFPDRPEGFAELFRLLRPGGRAAVYSWAPISICPAMNTLLEALHKGFPETLPDPDEHGKEIAKGLNDPNVFLSEMSGAGFVHVTVEPVVHSFPVVSPEAYWNNMVAASPPVIMVKKKIDPAEWDKKEQTAISWLTERLEGVNQLNSTAYLGIGEKPHE